MGEWIEKKLSEVCHISIGGTPSRAVSEYWDQDSQTQNFWVSIKDMNQKVIATTSERISKKGIANSNAKLVKGGTVLLSFKLSIGKVSIAGNDLFTNEAIAALEAFGIDNQFLFHGLHKWDLLQDVDQAVKGATLNKEKLKKIKFTIPKSLREQTTIATILTTIDQAIEKTEQLIAKYERVKTGLMQDLLTHGIDEQGRIRSEETHEFKDSPVGRIPKEWEVKTMADLCFVNPPKKKLPNGFLVSFLAMADVSDNAQIIGGSEVAFERVSNGFTSFLEGDVLVAKITPCFENGKGAFAQGLKNGVGYGSTEFHVLRHKEDVSGRLIYHITTSTKFRNAGKAVMIGSAGQQRVQKQFFEKYLFAFPRTKTEQERIVEILDNQDILIGNEQINLIKYQRMKTALMQDLLTGKVRVDALMKQITETSLI